MQSWIQKAIIFVAKSLPSTSSHTKKSAGIWQSFLSKMETESNEKVSGSSNEAWASNVKDGQQQRVIRIKKNKFALFLSYCGAGYNGLQRNPGCETIEEEILRALLKTKQINEEEFEKISQIHFQRAARTDKGVSAAVQVLSLQLPSKFSDPEVDQMNQHLPEAVQVIGAVKATKYFDAKNFCDGRTYSYIMPTFALAPPDSLTCEDYRATPEVVNEFRAVLNTYLGTHNYHNFTSGKEATDASAKRFIVSIEASDPFIKEGLEVIIVRIRGQSFMLHQIRKMIGTVIAVMKGFATLDTLKQSFLLDKIDLPRAPGLGLMLEDVHYDRYNKKFGGDGMHERLEWKKWSEKVHDFKHKFIYPVMMRTEKEEKSMLKWLECLPLHTYSKRECGPSGIIEYNPEPRTVIGQAMNKLGKYSEKAKLQKQEEEEIKECREAGDEVVSSKETDEEDIIVEGADELLDLEQPVAKKVKS
jgi:tRNA pseudouridine38-40 synthase